MFGNILRELQDSMTAAAAMLVFLLVLYSFRGRRAVHHIAAWFVALGMGAPGCHSFHGERRSAAESQSSFEAKQEKLDTTRQVENKISSAPEDTASSGTEEKINDVDTAAETNDSQSETREPPKKESAETNPVALNFARLEQAPEWTAFKKLWKKIHAQSVGAAKNRAMQSRLWKEIDSVEAGLMSLSEQNLIHEMHVRSLASVLKKRVGFAAESCMRLMLSHTIPSASSVSSCMEMYRLVDRMKALRKLKKSGHVNSETYWETMREIVSGTVAVYYWNSLNCYAFGGGPDDSLDATASGGDWQRSAAQIRELCESDAARSDSYDKQRCEGILSDLDTLEHLEPEIELLVHALEK
jgi:hypothetical protein